MKREYTFEQVPNPLNVLRKAGYSPFRDPQSGDESFILRLTSEFYPRFHLYVEDKKGAVSFNLHLDQKKPSYGDSHAHAGEYEGSTVEREMDRIDSWVKAAASAISDPLKEANVPKEDEREEVKKPTWWQKMFFGA
jgi:hypothetical protein